MVLLISLERVSVMGPLTLKEPDSMALLTFGPPISMKRGTNFGWSQFNGPSSFWDADFLENPASRGLNSIRLLISLLRSSMALPI